MQCDRVSHDNEKTLAHYGQLSHGGGGEKLDLADPGGRAV